MKNNSEKEFARILEIMARLRSSDGGCPWDLEQTFASIAPHTIEEAYEVAEAIESNDREALRGELGDLLFQVVFHSQMAKEAGDFDIADVLASLNKKMIDRHPHVFGEARVATATAQTDAWEQQKERERARSARSKGRMPSVLDGVTISLPALTRAAKIQARAARVGFDWPDAGPVFDKVREEMSELQSAMDAGANSDALLEEIGDLLFAVVNLARHLGLDAEGALRAATRKFERRFHRVEALLSEAGIEPAEASLDRMETAWTQAKSEEDQEI